MNSKKILKKATEIMPGGVSSPVRSLKTVNGSPLFVEKANGPYLFDVDNKKYIDLCMSFGPLVLGHANPTVVSDIQNAVIKGTTFGTSSPNEVYLAEKITEYHPAVEWVRFVNSGTEAVMSAIRLARGVTKRNLIIKFAGCYHGHADSMLAKAGSGLVTFGLSSSAGVPKDITKNTIVLELGNEKHLVEAFAKYGDDIAAVIMEGIPANNGLLIQDKSFLDLIEKITHSHGSLFILDEVITGFRIGWGGATEYYDIHPDIVTLGKVIGGGLPVGAYGGRKDLMQYIAPLGPVYQAGTLSGNPLAMAAGLSTLDEMKKNNIFERLEKIGSEFESKLISKFADINFPLSIQRVGSIVWLIFADNCKPKRPEELPESAVDNYRKFHNKALEDGIYLPPSAFEVAFISLAHENIIDELVDKLAKIGGTL